MTRTMHDIYFAKAFEAPATDLVKEVNEVMDGHEYDTIVGTGLSGTVFAAKVADGIGANLAILRKEGVVSHSDNRLEGMLGSKWMFVDDFVASGATLIRVLEFMRDNYPECEFVGAYSYGEQVEYPARFATPTELADRGTRLANAILGEPEGPEPYSTWYADSVYSYEYATYVPAWDTPEYVTRDVWLPENRMIVWGENVARYPVRIPSSTLVEWVDNPRYVR